MTLEVFSTSPPRISVLSARYRNMATEALLPPAPIPITDPVALNSSGTIDVAALKASLLALNNPAIKLPPDNTLRRYARAGIDLSAGYPYFPPKPATVQDVYEIRKEQTLRNYVDPGTRADKEKKALFGAAKEVRQLTTHIGVSDVPRIKGNDAALMHSKDGNSRTSAQRSYGPAKR